MRFAKDTSFRQIQMKEKSLFFIFMNKIILINHSHT